MTARITTNWHQLDRDFIARVRSARLHELRLMRQQFAGISLWRSACIQRAIDRLVLPR